MCKINFNVQHDNIAFQAFDVLYAYYQSTRQDYIASIEFNITDRFDPTADVNVYCDYMPNTLDYTELEKYNLILLSGSIEPLIVSTPAMGECLSKFDNCYLLCNSLVTNDHHLKDKIIWYPGNFHECRKLWIEFFYPMFFENFINLARPRTKNLAVINGQNRSWRHHFITLLKSSCPEIDIRSSFGDVVNETKDSRFESTEDTKFREWVNNTYKDVIIRNLSSKSHMTAFSAGINNKFGSYTPGYQILPDYFDYHCIIFPETTWQNNELGITEKSLKCFFAKTLPWPVGGSNLNLLYNQLGFFTAWNLLPPELQMFDAITNHQERYQAQIKSIQWLNDHPEVFDQDDYKNMVDTNKYNLYTTNAEFIAMQRFDKILKKYIP